MSSNCCDNKLFDRHYYLINMVSAILFLLFLAATSSLPDSQLLLCASFVAASVCFLVYLICVCVSMKLDWRYNKMRFFTKSLLFIVSLCSVICLFTFFFSLKSTIVIQSAIVLCCGINVLVLFVLLVKIIYDKILNQDNLCLYEILILLPVWFSPFCVNKVILSLTSIALN